MHDNKQVIRSYLLTDLDKIENRRIVKAEIFFLMNLVIVAFCRLTHPQTKLLDINPNVAPVCLALVLSSSQRDVPQFTPR